jgi:primosomal protein N' (replication factor Y) (superfamily II helicase)
VVDHWRCEHCGNTSPFVIAKGIDRTAEEIGKAIPGVKVMISKKDQVTSIDPDQNRLLSQPEVQNLFYFTLRWFY